MKYLIVFALVAAVLAAPKQQIYIDDQCETNCKLPDCKCSSTNIPNGFNASQIPQLVLLTFDDAVQVVNYEFYKDAFFNKTNPDGCPIGATYYISHEYTDYTLVNELYEKGHEIALHSITHTTMTDYWREASIELLIQEFDGEKDILNKFAHIPKEFIHGARIPFLQMSGDNSTQAFKRMGLMYDCSWPTQTFTQPGLWPYTLDYPSTQDCPIGPCPKKSAPGLWVQPMINMHDNSGVPCAMADACVDVPTDVDGLFDFMVKNFNVQYKGNKAPFGFYVHAAWFVQDNNRFEAYKKFIDYLLTLKDVYIVNTHRAIEYMKNPSTLDNLKESWPECVNQPKTTCTPTTCKLMKGKEERYMKICSTDCPKTYPWLGNPFGQ